MPLITTVVVPQLHDPVLLAKSLATGDMLCGGRLTVGIGVGGRHEDYRAVGADPSTQTMREMAHRVAIMKRVWAGEKITDSVLPVGPRPAAAGGPRCWSAPIGPKTLRSAARGPTVWPASPWISTSPNRTSCSMSVAPHGQQAGKPPPHLATSFWFALGDAAMPRPDAPASASLHELDPGGVSSTRWRRAPDGPATRTNWPRCCGRSRRSAPAKSTSSRPVTDLDQLRRVADVVADLKSGGLP